MKIIIHLGVVNELIRNMNLAVWKVFYRFIGQSNASLHTPTETKVLYIRVCVRSTVHWVRHLYIFVMKKIRSCDIYCHFVWVVPWQDRPWHHLSQSYNWKPWDHQSVYPWTVLAWSFPHPPWLLWIPCGKSARTSWNEDDLPFWWLIWEQQWELQHQSLLSWTCQERRRLL